jgi:hypothetical protein
MRDDEGLAPTSTAILAILVFAAQRPSFSLARWPKERIFSEILKSSISAQKFLDMQ